MDRFDLDVPEDGNSDLHTIQFVHPDYQYPSQDPIGLADPAFGILSTVSSIHPPYPPAHQAISVPAFPPHYGPQGIHGHVHGSESISDEAVPTRYLQQAPTHRPILEPASQSQYHQSQLEVLRETRRIRELELQIAEEKRRESEERRKEREAELALQEYQLRISSTKQTTPSPTPGHQPSLDWFQPSLQDLFGNHFNTPTSTLVSSTSLLDGTPIQSHALDATPSTQSPAPSPSSILSDSIAGTSTTLERASSNKTGGKKKNTRLVEEREACCSTCRNLVCKLQLRGERAELDVPYDMYYQCNACMPIQSTKSSRKRTNQVEDTALPTVCTVCTRIQGHGGFIAREKAPLMFTVEVICIPCSQKYKRCSNCGGGSTRGGIGKWRCKELFDENRKTCKLSHARLGARDMELSVWELPRDVEGKKELSAVLDACEQMWREHIYAKLAVPEILEHQSALTTFDDIEKQVLHLGFPARQMWTDPPLSPYHHLYVALTWTKSRARRDKTKPEWTQSSKEEKSIDEWVAYNTHRTLLIGTITPFDYADIEDRSTFSYGEILQRILNELMQHNADFPDDPWQPPEHLWVAIKANPYSLRQRLMETLERRLGFIPLEEYLTRYPGTTRHMFSAEATSWARAVNMRPTIDGKELSVLVRYLGKAITREGLERLKAGHLNKKPRMLESVG
ncbi:hypothetical protein EW146_g6681 [Bondarzewia mesenterica]|uniref:Uncharacterized protein n=1 Tax=Bondarzewia mesenterica TaxID=1095465 RepID=A0A4S4LPP8_9AGAM|nr:hypothetical protein EW146_g6681 [Bondarzewia mesenterica]